MDQLEKQNQELVALAEKYYKEMTDLQIVRSQHQNQIETLLKFNEKLLGIIEKQLGGHKKLKTSDILSLQPISQKTQIQSQMFQSQLTNVGNKLHMKNSLNIRPEPPLHQRLHKTKPLVGADTQQIMSIDVQHEKDQEGDSQLKNLIGQFKKKIKVGTGMLSVNEIQKKYKEQAQNLSKIKKQSREVGNQMLQKLSSFKNKISKDAKDNLLQMLQKVKADQSSKNILSAYISALQV